LQKNQSLFGSDAAESLASSARLMISLSKMIFTTIIIEIKSVKARTRNFRIASNARSPLDQAVTAQHRNRIEYYNIFYCLNKRARSQTTFTDCITKAN